MGVPSTHVEADNADESHCLRIMFWNARSICNKSELDKVIREYDIVVVVETWLSPEYTITYSHFNTYSLPRLEGRGGGIAFFIRKSLQYTSVSNIAQVCGAEIGGITVKNLSKPLTIFAVYRPPSNELSEADWETVVSNVIGYDNCLFMGDFNVHNEAWNCSRTDVEGTWLQEKTDDKSLFLHNGDTYTHYDPSSFSRSNLDLVFSSLDIAPHVHVDVTSDPLDSDHFPVSVNVDLQRSIYRRESFKVQSKRTDWNWVNESLESKYFSFMDLEYEMLPPVEKYNYFMEVITRAVSDATPERKVVSAATHRNPVSWWDEECYRAKRLRQAAFKKWEYSRKEEDRVLYNRMRSEARRLFRRKKRECYKKFASTVDFRQDTSYTWKKARILKNKWVKVSQNKTNNTVNETKLCDALDKVCPPFVPNDPNFLPTSENQLFLDSPFSYSEFNIALSSRGDKSAPGLDGVNYQVLHHVSIKYHLLLLDILNEMYATDSYPETWRDTFVHFAEKPNGEGYRPLALTSCICKTFELMLSNRLRWWTETKGKINKTQTGFRKGYSCSDNLAIYKLDIEEALKEKLHVLSVYLDVSNAFNEVQSDILLVKLANIGCSTKVIKFVKFITTQRQIYTEINMDAPRLCHKGVPQGGVLSPLLYLLYVSDAVKFGHPMVKILQYADDIVIYVSTDDLELGKDVIEDAVQCVSQNLKDIGLEVSPKKTEVVHFNKLGVLPGEISIKIQDSHVPSTDSVKFLGIYFDYNMTFATHQRYVSRKTSASLNILKFLRGVHWGADPSTLLSFYKSFTRSIIDYCSYIYFPTQKDRILKLERIQFSAIRLALGLRKSTPTNILLAEANLLSLHIRAKLLCNNFLLKVYSKTDTITRNTIDKHARKIIFNCSLNIDTLRRCIKSIVGIKHQIYEDTHASIYNYHFNIFREPINIDFDLGKSLKDADHPNVVLYASLVNSDALNIYTDGSKKENVPAVGSACVVPELESIRTVSLNPKASIFTAECLALSRAMDIALTHSHRDVNILTDSYSALQTLGSPKIRDNINLYLLQVMQKNLQFSYANSRTRKITLYWVPSHMGIIGNESADIEAKAATLLTPTVNRIPYTDHKPFFKRLAWSENKRYILEEGLLKGIHYFQRIEELPTKPWYKGLNLKRDMQVFISRARSHHYSLNESLKKIGVSASPNCECQEIQNLNHVLWQCHLHQEQRDRLIKKLAMLKLHPPFDIDSFLFPPNIEVLQNIYSFLCEINKKI